MSAGRRKLQAVLVIVLTAVVFASQPAPPQTEAVWADTELGAGSFTAATIAPVTMTACTFNPGLLGIAASYTITYRMPAGSTDTLFEYSTTAGFGTVTVLAPTITPSATANHLDATISLDLLGGVLTGAKYFGLSARFGSEWKSTRKVAQGSAIVLGAATCSVVA